MNVTANTAGIRRRGRARRYGASLGGALLSLLLAATTAATSSAAPAGARPPPDLLVDQHGAPVPPARLANRILLVYFGYTNCPDLCPAALSVMSAALRELGAAGDAVQPVFVTVDPARDTIAVLRGYARHFHPRLLALTGSNAAIADAAKSFNVQFKPVRAAARGDYAVDHSVLIYLADRDGSVVRGFHPSQTAQDIAAAIRPLLAAPGAKR